MTAASAETENKACVIIAAYNAADTIARAIRSALHEPEIAEVIVVDDASKDNTAEAARAADDGSDRLKVLIQPQNGGPSAARNRAICESRSPWIAILDADDLFMPGRMVRLLQQADRAELIADDCGRTPEGHVHGPYTSLLGRYVKQPRDISLIEFVLSNVSRAGRDRAELGFLKPILRRRFLDQHNIRYQETMRLGEDYELYTRMMVLGGRFRVIPEQGYVSVMRPHSLSGMHRENDLLQLRDCDTALSQLPGLTAKQKTALRKHSLSVDCKLQWRLLILAVKQRDPGRALATFFRPLPVPFFLIARLFEQLVLRSFKMVCRNG